MQLITLSDYTRHGSTVRAMAPDHPACVVRVSKNLRGLLDHARADRVACIITRKDFENPCRGELTVVYRSGTIGRASFCSHSILIDWMRRRRTWRQAEIRHVDGDMGYLTKPGKIVGA